MDHSDRSDRTRWPAVLTILVLCIVGAGCDVAEAGKDGRLLFELDSDDRIIPARFDTPLAADQRVDLRVYDADSGAAKTPAAVRAAPRDVFDFDDDPEAHYFADDDAGTDTGRSDPHPTSDEPRRSSD